MAKVDKQLLQEKIQMVSQGVDITFSASEGCSYFGITKTEFDMFCKNGLGPHQVTFGNELCDLRIGREQFYSLKCLDNWKTKVYDKLAGKGGALLKRVRNIAASMVE